MKLLVHMRELKQEWSKQEGEKNPQQHLQGINKGNEWTPDKGKLRLIHDAGQPKLGNEGIDLRAGAVLGDEAMPSGRIETVDRGDIGEGSQEGVPIPH